jgi:hypothetical protein
MQPSLLGPGTSKKIKAKNFKMGISEKKIPPDNNSTIRVNLASS